MFENVYFGLFIGIFLGVFVGYLFHMRFSKRNFYKTFVGTTIGRSSLGVIIVILTIPVIIIFAVLRIDSLEFIFGWVIGTTIGTLIYSVKNLLKKK